ncbi:PREDICTED: probable 2-oxoglutarate-dependent dioxygenase AOP1.2 [Camelina sativa]|uniref:Probable 2-oxoglutarate-dependent dioxygenase AOP1.2 n=1 Tax=Camelina sativa TaxID=90675 RepID=A0ABM0YHD6_CAMSA|nr:PREDICTED: probable 2-oxoglutarate-dependent dioxygenase AOP1.2 [Camelina sativa]
MVSLETTLAVQLPVINFRDLKPGTFEWDSVRGNFRKALEEYGCFEALFDKVPVELRKAVFDASDEVFQLPLETKQRVVSKRKYRGYVGQIPTLPFFEVMGIDFAEDADKVNAFTHKLWPQGNTSFSEAVMSFAEKVSVLDFMTRRMIMESFWLDENYIDEHLKSMKCLNNVKDGIKVKTIDDKHWIKANPSQDSSFIVLDGAMLHVLLNGRVRTGVHQVMRMGTNTRFSAGLFSFPKTEDLIYAPQEMVDAEHPHLYKPIDFEGYFQYTTEGPGRRDLWALRSYCGLCGYKK